MTAFAPPDPAAAAPPPPDAPPDPALPPPDAALAPPSDPALPAPPTDLALPAAPEPVEPQAPPPADPLQVEAMVAAIGIKNFLAHKVKRVHLYQVSRAAAVGDDVDRKLYLFINRKKPAKSAELPPFDFEEVRQLVETDPLDDQNAEVIAAFGTMQEAGLAAVRLVEKIQAYLKPKVPHRRRMTLAGPVDDKPPHSELARFRRLWNIACDPMSILDDLNEYAVSRDMVQAIFDLYPKLWKRIDEGVTSQLARKTAASIAAGTKWSLSVRKDLILRVLVRDETAASKQLGIAMQEHFAKLAAEAAPKPPRAKGKNGASSESSAADRVDAN